MDLLPNIQTQNPRFTFQPSDQELIAFYLRRKISGQPLDIASAQFIHEADVYSADPATLTGHYTPALATTNAPQQWYFLSYVRSRSRRDRRRSRTVGSGDGCWHPEKAAKAVVDGRGRCVGYRKSFSYKTKSHGKSDWLMVECGIDQEEVSSGNGQPILVICKLYKTPRARRAEAPTEPSQPLTGCKRTATDERSQEARRVRPRLPPPIEPTASQAETAVSWAEDDSAESHRKLELLESMLMADEPEMSECALQLTDEYSMLVSQQAETADSWTADNATESRRNFELLESMLMADEPDISLCPLQLTDEWSVLVSPQTETANSWTGDNATGSRRKLGYLEGILMTDEPDMSPSSSMAMATLDMPWASLSFSEQQFDFSSFLPSEDLATLAGCSSWSRQQFDPLPSCSVF